MIVFGADSNESTHFSNRSADDVIIFGKGLTQKINKQTKDLSADFNATNAQKTGLHGNIYDFSVEYGVFSDFEVYNIHRYLLNKNDILTNKTLSLLKLIRKVLLMVSISGLNLSKRISFKNQECKIREVTVNK